MILMQVVAMGTKDDVGLERARMAIEKLANLGHVLRQDVFGKVGDDRSEIARVSAHRTYR